MDRGVLENLARWWRAEWVVNVTLPAYMAMNLTMDLTMDVTVYFWSGNADGKRNGCDNGNANGNATECVIQINKRDVSKISSIFQK